jgi:hypothetical protein
MLVLLKCSRAKEIVMLFRDWNDSRDPRSEKGAIRLAAGMVWQGYTYEELVRLGSGVHDLELPRQPLQQGPIGRKRSSAS